MAKQKKANKTHYGKARASLRKWLVKYSGCAIQEGVDGGYPCGTCTIALLNGIGLDSKKKMYNEHNKGDERDRHNEVWRAILQIRDAKL